MPLKARVPSPCSSYHPQLTPGTDSQTFTLDQVASHTSPDNGVWLVVEGGVYDVCVSPTTTYSG